ncbi:uncharacterized protein EI90DRAFT_3081674 [Cantharellus anzutake]|uniref:uncharacterized protein n=1 Tax=Cantharellus anzutake TaxID=1750568 RepID=UPI001903F017|nr:uncharacterized protein EI90DRAFT_3081674 [Cantharellus anzutake]KAF8319859.1 hypothetical protein EI90DRAFT_3081674 [Cantharellus anzutake]
MSDGFEPQGELLLPTQTLTIPQFTFSSRTGIELPPIPPVSPLATDLFRQRTTQSCRSGGAKSLINASINAQQSTLSTSAGPGIRVTVPPIDHIGTGSGQVGMKRQKLRPKKPLQIFVSPSPETSTAVASEFPLSLRSAVPRSRSQSPTPKFTSHSQTYFSKSDSKSKLQGRPPSSPVSFVSFLSISSPSAPSSPTPSENELRRARSRLDKLKRILGGDVPDELVLKDVSVERFGPIVESRTQDTEDLEISCCSDSIPLMPSASASIKGCREATVSSGRPTPSKVPAVNDTDLSNQAQKIRKYEIPEIADLGVSGRKMSTKERNELVRRVSKVSKIFGAIPPSDVCQPISKSKSADPKDAHDNESFIELDSDSYEASRSSLCFSLYADSTTSSSLPTASDDGNVDTATLNGDATAQTHKNQGSPCTLAFSEESCMFVLRYHCLRTPTPTTSTETQVPPENSGATVTYMGNERFPWPSKAPSPEPFAAYSIHSNPHKHQTVETVLSSRGRDYHGRSLSAASVLVPTISANIDSDSYAPTPEPQPRLRCRGATTIGPCEPQSVGTMPTIRAHPSSSRKNYQQHGRSSSTPITQVPTISAGLEPDAGASAPKSLSCLQRQGTFIGPCSAPVDFPPQRHIKQASSSVTVVEGDSPVSREQFKEFQVRRRRAAKLMKFFGEPVNLTYDHVSDLSSRFASVAVRQSAVDAKAATTLLERRKLDPTTAVATKADINVSLLKRRGTTATNGVYLDVSASSNARIGTRGVDPECTPLGRIPDHQDLPPRPRPSGGVGKARKKSAVMVIDTTKQATPETYERALAILRNM